MKFFLSLEACEAAEAADEDWGAQAVWLARAHRAGASVPAGVMLSTPWAEALRTADREAAGTNAAGQSPQNSRPSPWPPLWQERLREAVASLEAACGAQFAPAGAGGRHGIAAAAAGGGVPPPLLLRLRATARPGWQGLPHGVANLGLTRQGVPALGEAWGDLPAAWDALRRLAASYGQLVLGLQAAAVEQLHLAALAQEGVEAPLQLSAAGAQGLAEALCALCAERGGADWCACPWQQLERALATLLRGNAEPLERQRLAFAERGLPMPELSALLQPSLCGCQPGGGPGACSCASPTAARAACMASSCPAPRERT